MNKISASQPQDHEGHDHDSSYDTCTGWFQEADSKVINLSCNNLFHNRAKINMFKLIILSLKHKLFIKCIIIFLSSGGDVINQGRMNK